MSMSLTQVELITKATNWARDLYASAYGLHDFLSTNQCVVTHDGGKDGITVGEYVACAAVEGEFERVIDDIAHLWDALAEWGANTNDKQPAA
jgi:hypothetical protein